MAKHEFGIMERPPIHGERYDCYEPEKYHCICVDDDWIEGLLPAFARIDLFWHCLDVPRKGLAYCGITLIPPESMAAVIEIIQDIPGLEELKHLLFKAKDDNRFIIHFGL